MKLNRAYTQSLNDSIERIKLLFSDEEKFSRFNFTSKQFTGAIKEKQVPDNLFYCYIIIL